MKDQQMKERIWSGAAEFCSSVIEIAAPGMGRQRLEPDESKAYIEFKLAHAYTKRSPVVTAYGTALHPGTVARSYASMYHQVFDLGHKMRSYDKSAEKKDIPRDYMLGTIVGVEYPELAPGAPAWTVAVESAPAIRAAAVIHKQAEKVPQVLGEHMGGRHKWTVSMELEYSLLASGFMVGNPNQWSREQKKLLGETTPSEFNQLGIGYVQVENAPDELLDTWDFKGARIKPADKGGLWGDSPVTLLKGGLNGEVHFKGVGLVRYGAEKEAEVQQILASDPNRLLDLAEEWDEAAAMLRAVMGATVSFGQTLADVCKPIAYSS